MSYEPVQDIRLNDVPVPALTYFFLPLYHNLFWIAFNVNTATRSRFSIQAFEKPPNIFPLVY
jgi:hypothetical protein